MNGSAAVCEESLESAFAKRGENIKVMVNGLPGKMASKVFEHIRKDSRFLIVPYSLTGAEIEEGFFNPGIIELVKPVNRQEKIENIIHCHFPFISVDFTQPSAVNENADFYCRNRLPFVMGTTGGERGKKGEPGKLELSVINSDIPAVIAPNMAKQIVAFQAMMEDYSKENCGVLKDCKLSIIESHQQGKKDTSGTARAMVKYFNNLGIPFTEDKIDMIREPKKQLEIGVPEEHLAGHGWHRYIISSKQGNDCISHLALGLKGFLWTNNVFSDYNGFSRRPQTEGNQIIWNRPPIGEIIIDDNIMDKTYRISKDRTVGFSLERFSNKLLVFNHNVNGRDIYAEGTIDAIKYLDKKIKEGSKGQAYSMIDVLKGK